MPVDQLFLRASALVLHCTVHANPFSINSRWLRQFPGLLWFLGAARRRRYTLLTLTSLKAADRSVRPKLKIGNWKEPHSLTASSANCKYCTTCTIFALTSLVLCLDLHEQSSWVPGVTQAERAYLLCEEKTLEAPWQDCGEGRRAQRHIDVDVGGGGGGEVVQRCILGAHSCLTDTAIHHPVYQRPSGSAASVLQLSIM